MSTTTRRARVRAPELTGRGWLNTGGADVRLADLRGKIVLLDFWTFCCINCLHVLDELRPLEDKYSDVLVTVGVHSPKFEHEADADALAAAVERYAVHHPVLDDPELVTWQQYAVRAWPTLVVVDPEGYVVAHLSGEGHAHMLDRLLADLVAEHEAKGTLHRGDGPYVAPPAPDTALRFPGKAIALPGGTLLVSDTGHHSLVELAADGETVLRRIGSGQRGLVDGGPDDAAFSEPQGLCLLPDEVRTGAGYDVVVADTVNHALRGVRLDTGEVTTLAGSGQPWMQGSGTADLSSPWDVAWLPHDPTLRDARDAPGGSGTSGANDLGRVVVAMAGIHQLWTFDVASGSVAVLAGTTNEGLLDGPLADAWFAQPSGLAAASDRLWLVDAETSSLRYVRDGEVTTAIGTGLFDFGHVDGPAAKALLQHPLGVTVLPDGSVAVCDTYNGAVRRYDPSTEQVTTLLTGLAEPSAATCRRRPPARGRVRRTSPDPAATARRRTGRRRRCPAHAPARRRGLSRRGRAAGRLRGAAGTEARRALRPRDPAGRVGDTARPAARRRGSRHRPHPPDRARRPRRRRRAARGGDGRVLRRGRRGVPGLSRPPAGLGRTAPACRRRTRRAPPAPLRQRLRRTRPAANG